MNTASRSRVARLVVGVVACVLLAGPVAAQGTVFLVRHAERADAGTTPKPGADPVLSEAGHVRATSLAATLKDAGVTAIFVTEYRRTQQTAAPLAKLLGLTPVTIPSKDIDGLVARVKQHSGSALVVGHSNSVPEVITALGVPTPIRIADDEFDNLFLVLTGEAPRLVRLRYR